jgi:hypothetical protein
VERRTGGFSAAGRRVRRSPQDEKLVAKEHDLSFATGMRSEQSDKPTTEQFEEVDDPGKATASLRLCQPG